MRILLAYSITSFLATTEPLAEDMLFQKHIRNRHRNICRTKFNNMVCRHNNNSSSSTLSRPTRTTNSNRNIHPRTFNNSNPNTIRHMSGKDWLPFTNLFSIPL